MARNTSNSTEQKNDYYDVVIVGAGQAGLAAAYRLAFTHNCTVLVLEASDHVGGRTRNFDFARMKHDEMSDDSYELGGTWLSPQHLATLDLVSDIGLEVFNASFLGERCCASSVGHDNIPSAENGEELPWWYWGVEYSKEEMDDIHKTILHLHSDQHGLPQKVTFKTPSELIQALGEVSVAELETAGTKIEADTITLGEENCWHKKKIRSAWKDLDYHSTEKNIAESLKTLNARTILRNVIRNKNADDPHRVSYLYNLISFKGCNSAGEDSQYRVRGGTQAIPIRITELLKKRPPNEVLLNSPVRCVRVFNSNSGGTIKLEGKYEDDDFSKLKQDVSIEVKTQNGHNFIAKAAIITGAPPAVDNIIFEPELPKDQRQLLKQMPMGRCLKFAAIYNCGPWWREHGLQGDILVCGLPKEFCIPEFQETSPIFGYFFDLSPFSRKVGIISCFLEGASYDYFTSLPEDRQNALVRNFLRQTFEDLVDDEARDKRLWEPDSFLGEDWGPRNHFTPGAYTSYFPPKVLSNQVYWDAYRKQEKLPNVYFSGADYHVGFGHGYIEGAIRSGQQAADLIHKSFTERKAK